MSKDRAEETIRERWEKLEYEILAPCASRAAESRGRARPEEKCGIRTDYQRDRDRILHCKAFRRLKHKTQVFIAPEVDHYRTRLTHTLEVAQIARTIARGLRLNEDLTEAIALGHDLGHTPFGHAGEAALNEVLSERVSGMRFNHFEQSVRVVDLLENDGRGLNLTYETWDGIRYHSKGGADILEDKDAPETWEGWAVRLSDRIAYISHDVDDAIRAGLVSVGDLPGKVLDTLGRTHSARINSMVRDVVTASVGRDRISMTSEVRAAADSLKDFLYEKVYSAEAVKNPKGLDVKGIVRLLVERFLANPKTMPPFYYQMHTAAVDERGRAQAVADFVAGMTDRYAARLADVALPSE